MSRRRNSRRGWAFRALGLGLVLVLGASWLAFGGVHHGTRSVLHAGLCVLFLVAGTASATLLERGSAGLRVGAVAVAALAVTATALLPLPAGLLAWLAPGVLDARPDTSWWTLSLDPEATVGELCDLLLPAGAGILAAFWSGGIKSRSLVERGLVIGAAVALGFGLAHAFSSSTALLGLVPSSVDPPKRFFAPFVNSNHFGSFLLLGWPLVLLLVTDRSETPSRRVAAAVLAAGIVAALVLVGSSGAVMGAAAAGILLALRSVRTLGVLVAVLGAGAVGALGWFGFGDSGSAVTFGGRVDMWTRVLTAWPHYWLVGSGGGTFQQAMLPTHHDFTVWAHAHDDYVEWFLEHGALGVLVAGAALIALWPRAVAAERRRARAAAVTLGVVGVAVHALVDFPFQIPAIGMVGAALLSFRLAAYQERGRGSVGAARTLLIGFALAQGAASAWEARSAVVDLATTGVRVGRADAHTEVRALQWLAPWRAEIGLFEAWTHLEMGRPEQAVATAREVVARHPDDAWTLRDAGRILARAGDPDAAEAAFARALVRFPGDWRTRVARALDAPPDRAAEAWHDAFVGGAPFSYLAAAWEVVPEGLYWLDAARSREPRFAEQLGGFLVDRGELEVALLAYEQARLSDPAHPLNPFHLRLLLRLQRLDEAERLVAEELARRPDSPQAVRLKAEIVDAQGRYAEARDLWVQTSERYPELFARALIAAEKADDAQAALKLAERMSLVRPMHPIARLELARLYRDTGQFGRCVAEVDRSGLAADQARGRRARALKDSCRGR